MENPRNGHGEVMDTCVCKTCGKHDIGKKEYQDKRSGCFTVLRLVLMFTPTPKLI